MHIATHNTMAQKTPRPVERVGVVGANETSLDIVLSLLDAELPVTLFEPARDSLEELVAQARTDYQAAVARGELAPDARDRRMALLAGTVNFHHLKDCDLIIDTVSADPAGTEQLFRRLDQVAKPDAVLATLASHVSVDDIARCTRRLDDVLGLHVLPFASAGEAWQPVPGRDTSDATLDTVRALARRVHGKAVPGEVRLAS